MASHLQEWLLTLKNGGVKKAVKNGAHGQGAMKSLYTGGTAGPAMVLRTRTTMSCWSCTDAPCNSIPVGTESEQARERKRDRESERARTL